MHSATVPTETEPAGHTFMLSVPSTNPALVSALLVGSFDWMLVGSFDWMLVGSFDIDGMLVDGMLVGSFDTDGMLVGSFDGLVGAQIGVASACVPPVSCMLKYRCVKTPPEKKQPFGLLVPAS